MGEVVKSNMTIMYLKLGAVYYPIACGTDSRITLTTEEIETAARSSSDFREYKYGRKSGSISGSHLVKISTAPDNLYTVFDLVGFQISSVPLLVKYSVSDGVNSRVFECNTIIKNFELTRSAGQMLRGSYELLISGPVTISATPVVDVNPQIKVFEYTATGDETTINTGFPDDCTILVVYVNGLSYKVFFAPDGYGPNDVQYDEATKVLTFGSPLTTDDYVKVMYVEP